MTKKVTKAPEWDLGLASRTLLRLPPTPRPCYPSPSSLPSASSLALRRAAREGRICLKAHSSPAFYP